MLLLRHAARGAIRRPRIAARGELRRPRTVAAHRCLATTPGDDAPERRVHDVILFNGALQFFKAPTATLAKAARLLAPVPPPLRSARRLAPVPSPPRQARLLAPVPPPPR